MIQGSHSLVNQFVLLWVVMEPITVVTLFVGLTGELTEAERRRVSLIAVLVAGAVILFFIVAGQLLLQALNVDLIAFQIAGGIILFAFSMMMILGRVDEPPPTRDGSGKPNVTELAIFPLATPILAGPGTLLAVILLTDRTRFSATDNVETAGVAALVLAIIYGMLLAAYPIHRFVGAAGSHVVTRVAGLVLAAIAANVTLSALRTYFG
ncbi:MAG: MarC family protein [Bauldia sp.]